MQLPLRCGLRCILRICGKRLVSLLLRLRRLRRLMSFGRRACPARRCLRMHLGLEYCRRCRQRRLHLGIAALTRAAAVSCCSAAPACAAAIAAAAVCAASAAAAAAAAVVIGIAAAPGGWDNMPGTSRLCRGGPSSCSTSGT